MRFCTSCGHQLGVGRFCTNCGLRVENPAADHGEWRTDTAERPAVPAEPPAPRFALYADEPVPGGSGTVVDGLDGLDQIDELDQIDGLDGPDGPEDSDDLVPLGFREAPPRPSRQQRRLFAVLVSIVAVWALVAVGGAVLLVRSRSDDRASAKDARPSATLSSPTSPTTDPTPTPTPPPPRVDVAPLASARAPLTAPPTTDVDGASVTFGAAHMLDHDHTTCWRMPGDGTNATVVFTLRRPTRISRVGLVNGYAKVAHDSAGNELDWYAGNRRILAVQWEFDDGTTVEQQLRENRRIQTIKVPRKLTSTVRLKILSVTDPGDGIASRDYTAISEISLIGRPT